MPVLSTLRLFLLVCGPPLLLLAACRAPAGSSRPAAADSAPRAEPRPAAIEEGLASEPVQVEMKRVDSHVDEAIVLHVRHLRGALVRTRARVPPSFDDPSSFIIDINSAEIAIETDDLGRLLNKYVFSYSGSPLKRLEVSIDQGRLKQEGVIHKVIDIPFSMKGDVGATPDGKLQVRVESIKTAGIPAKGLMDFFGLELDRLIKVRQGRGVTVKDDVILLDPERLLPPPKIRGRLTAVRIQGDRIIQVFGSRAGARAAPLRPPEPRGNHMYYRGGVLRFGKLTMTGADLQLIDADPSDPFDFSQARYEELLVAGYSKITPGGGLKTYMPDVADVSLVRARGGLRP